MGTKSSVYRLTSGIFFFFIFMLTSTLAFSEVVELSTSQDTYINNRKSNKSYSSDKYIRVRDSRRNQRQGLIKFDLPNIAEGSVIEKAELWLYVAYKRGSGILTVSEILEGWDESVNWNSRPEASGLPEDSANVTRSGIYYKFDLTNLSQAWIDGVTQNNGIHIQLEDSAYIIINSENNSANRPKLMITYSEPEEEPVAETDTDTDPEPINTIQPHPNPVPLADAGVSDAPLRPVDKRIVIVSKDGTGDYRTISDAINQSKPGDTIQVKDGIYEERVAIYTDGTKELPIALLNFPGHSPVIDPGGGEYPSDCCPEGGTQRVEIHAKWIIVQGFEIRYGWEGIKIYDDHITIRGNWIHHNSFAGILVVSASDVFIDNNTIESNGTEQGSCSINGNRSPKQCHGIYFSEYFCDGMSDNTVRGNAISNHGGRAIQWNAEHCGSNSVIRNTLVENNIMENNSWGMVLYYNTQASLIINNTIVIEDYPETNDTNHTFVGIYGSKNNIFMNNIFYSSRNDVSPLFILDPESRQNFFDYNLWKENNGGWYWGGDWKVGFQNYPNVSGWGSNAVMNSNPGFVDLNGGNYHLTSASKARNNGTNSYCAQTDIDNEPRNASPEDICDIGADERF